MSGVSAIAGDRPLPLLNPERKQFTHPRGGTFSFTPKLANPLLATGGRQIAVSEHPGDFPKALREAIAFIEVSSHDTLSFHIPHATCQQANRMPKALRGRQVLAQGPPDRPAPPRARPQSFRPPQREDLTTWRAP
jgi:hypothetical protein